MDPLTVILAAVSTAETAWLAKRPGRLGRPQDACLAEFGAKDAKLDERTENIGKILKLERNPPPKVLSDVDADQDQELEDQTTELLKNAEAAEPGVSGGLVGKINAQGGKGVVANVIHGGATATSRLLPMLASARRRAPRKLLSATTRLYSSRVFVAAGRGPISCWATFAVNCLFGTILYDPLLARASEYSSFLDRLLREAVIKQHDNQLIIVVGCPR